MKRHLVIIGYISILVIVTVVGVYFNLAQSTINNAEKARLTLLQTLDRYQTEYYSRAIQYHEIPAAVATLNIPSQDLSGNIQGVNKGKTWWAWAIPYNSGEGRICLRAVDGHFYWIRRTELSTNEMEHGKPEQDALFIQ
jgi:hypothetical protein